MAVKARAELTLASVSDGKPGSNGVGIKSTAISYQAGASQTKPPTGSWSAEPPKLTTALPYLWTKTYITYTDGKTSTSYSVSSTLDGIEVGGRNFARDTSDQWSEWITPRYDSINSTHTFSTVYMPEDFAVGDEFTIYFEIEFSGIKESPNISPGDFMITTNMYVFIDPVTQKPDYSIMPPTKYIRLNSAPADGIQKWTGVSTIKSTQTEIKGFCCNIRCDYVTAGKYRIRRLKYERGNKATDWTPAPEDVQQGIDDAQNSANDANNKVDNITETVTKTSAELKVLSDSISSLVTDAKGQSLMTQTGSGWTFNIGSIQSALNGVIGDIQDVKGDINGVKDLADRTNELANDVAKKTAYINMTQDESGQPVMELGQQNGEFKLRITNTSMDFMQGSQKIAYLSNRQLYIQSSVVTDEMKIGATSGYIWKKRGNGNMGLRYVSGGGSV